MEGIRNFCKKNIFIIFILIVGFVIGYALATWITINAVADIASRFIDADLVEKAIYQYKNNIGTCYSQMNLSLS